MTNEYIELFKTLTQGTEILAEKVYGYNNEKGNRKNADLAISMQDNYRALKEKFERENFNSEELTRADYAKLLVCAVIMSQTLENQLQQIEQAIKGYNTNLIPKLNQILNESENTYEAVKIAEKLFS